MKPLYKLLLISILSIVPVTLNAQILISILFGDALNSEKIEFGLAGGFNQSYILTIDESKGLNNFDLGFYFHINLKNSSYLSTGVHVKSNVGATGMITYPLNDAAFDSLYQNGTLTKKIPAFYIPILFHQRFNNRWYIEAGPQLGLIHNAVDIFDTAELGGDLRYTRETMEEYKRIDIGLLGGVGYKFKKQTKSMAVGVNYYYGLVNVSKIPDLAIKNSTVYVYVKIPIGTGKTEEPSN